MLEQINDYLAYQGEKYVKPEKAGPLADYMTRLKGLGQDARQEFAQIAKELETRVAPFEMNRVSNWANQAQIIRPHFWAYFRGPMDQEDDVALAIRLYGKQDDFGISVEVSFVERKKSEVTLAKQHRVLDLPIQAPLYYFAQVDGVSQGLAGTETNRQSLKQKIATGQVRKVLVKYDVPINSTLSQEDLLIQLSEGFERLLPYYEVTKP